MTKRSDASLVALLLTNRLVDVDAKPLTAKQFWPLTRSVDDLSTLMSNGGVEIPGTDPDRVDTLLRAASGLAFELERLENSGVWIVSGIDDEYPERLRERLGDAAPPLLVGAGPISLLSSGGLAVVGSRDVSPEGAEVARAAAHGAADRGWTVISGGARGVDQLSMHAAHEAGTPVVGLLADGITRQLREVEVRHAIQEERACFCSPYKPDAGFQVGNAMGRNKLLYATADISLVVASDNDSGGTWAGATESLKRGFGRVAVWRGDGEGPGNAALEDLGATPIEDLGSLFEPGDRNPTPASATRDPEVEQMGLELH